MFEEKTFSRRSFVRGSAAVTALAAAGKPTSAKPEPAKSSDASETVPERPLGKTGAKVSILGVGGFHLGSTKDQNEANQLVAQALDAGVTFFDNCWDYHDGLSEERLGVATRRQA